MHLKRMSPDPSHIRRQHSQRIPFRCGGGGDCGVEIVLQANQALLSVLNVVPGLLRRKGHKGPRGCVLMFCLDSRACTSAPELMASRGCFIGNHVDMYEHNLQAGTRALRAGEPEETVVVALLHDIGEAITPNCHGEIAAGMCAPSLHPQGPPGPLLTTKPSACAGCARTSPSRTTGS